MPTKMESFAPSQLQLLLDAPSIDIFSLDCRYRYLNFSRGHAQSMLEIWGRSVSLQANFLQDVILDHRDRLKLKSNLDRVLHGEELVLVEAYGAGAARRLYENRYFPLRDDEDEIVGVTVIGTDVSERVELAEDRLALEQKLLESSQLKSLGLMVGCVAHDFNNLLVPILLSAQVAQNCVDPEHPASQLLSTVIDSTKNAAELTKQLLNLLGRDETAKELIDLNALIDGAAELARVSMRRRADLLKSLSENPLPIFAQPTQMRQLIMNLLINASEAARGEQPQVRLDTALMKVDGKIASEVLLPLQVSNGLYAVMTVSDNGCGMTKEQLGRIFEPFYSTKGPGRGFGLTVIQGIVRKHNGFLAIDSQPGCGSTFKIGIPLVLDAALDAAYGLPDSGSQVAKAGGAPLRILIAEGNSAVLTCLTRICQERGHGVVAATNGLATVVAIDAQEFDLILFDAEMPGVSCEEMLRAIPEFADTAVVLMSAGLHESWLIASPRVHSVLAKPFSLARLDDLLSRIEPQFSGR